LAFSESINIKNVNDRLAFQQGKSAPQVPEMEEAVLGAILIDKDSFSTVNELISPSGFYNEAHQVIYQAMLELYNNAEPIDTLSVVRQLRKTNQIQKVGGAKYIATLSSKVNSSANIEYHALAISQAAVKREMISVANEIMAEGFSDTNDIFDLLNKTEQSFFSISEKNIKKWFKVLEQNLV